MRDPLSAGKGRPVLFETDEGGLRARAVAGGGSDVLAVVFSQVRVPAGSFGLSRLFARTRHACLFLNQPSAAWYRGADAAIDAAIGRAGALTRPGRVVLYGSSIGGWGALRTAERWPEARVVAYAPDFRPGEPMSRAAEAGLGPAPDEPGLADLLARPRAGSTDVVIGLFDPYDAGVAARLAAASLPPGVRVVAARAGHEVHDHLYTVNVVRRIIGTFTRDVAAAIGERGLLHPPVEPWRLSAFAALAAVLDRGERADPAAVRALGLADNPGAALLEAAAAESTDDLAGAAAVLERLAAEVAATPALATLPKRYLKQIPRRRIDLLARLGRFAEASAVQRAAAATYPADTSFAAAADPNDPVETT